MADDGAVEVVSIAAASLRALLASNEHLAAQVTALQAACTQREERARRAEAREAELEDAALEARAFVCDESIGVGLTCQALAMHRVAWSDRVTYCCDEHLADALHAAAHDGEGDRTDDPWCEAVVQDEAVEAAWPRIRARRQAAERAAMARAPRGEP